MMKNFNYHFKLFLEWATLNVSVVKLTQIDWVPNFFKVYVAAYSYQFVTLMVCRKVITLGSKKFISIHIIHSLIFADRSCFSLYARSNSTLARGSFAGIKWLECQHCKGGKQVRLG